MNGDNGISVRAKTHGSFSTQSANTGRFPDMLALTAVPPTTAIQHEPIAESGARSPLLAESAGVDFDDPARCRFLLVARIAEL
jgi:hypothetical protein